MRIMKIYCWLLLIVIASLSACKESENPPLPILGLPDIVNGDTLQHKIPPFEFLDQDSSQVDNSTLQPFLYIADFFFMSCPSICPKVKKQMLRIYDRYEDNDKIKLVSFTIDPKRDTPARLKLYANNLNVTSSKWKFLHGDKDATFELADDFFVSAYPDPDAPGGFDHSGKLLLVDTNGHIRAFAEGTDPEDVTEFFKDIDLLIEEYAEE